MINKRILFPFIAGILALSMHTPLVLAQENRVITRLDLLGDSVSLNTAQRTILITPDTKYVNVTGGEIVKFVSGEKSFAWFFDVGLTVSSFELNAIAPKGLLTQKIIVYVTPDPKYRNP